MNDTSSASSRPFFELTDVRFRLWPILLAAVVMQVWLVMAPRGIGIWMIRSFPMVHHAPGWVPEMLVLLLQTVCGLVGIVVLRRVLPSADPCLRWPLGRSYVGTAIALGAAMAFVMFVADYWPSLLTGKVPDSPFPIVPGTTSGWLVSMAMAGVAEEIGFRGLLVGMLVVLVPGRLRAGRFEIPIAGVLVGVLFGLAHYQSFIYSPFHLAFAQLIYAFAWGLGFVWLMERSRSLLAPIVAHSLSDFLEIAAVILLMHAWK